MKETAWRYLGHLLGVAKVYQPEKFSKLAAVLTLHGGDALLLSACGADGDAATASVAVRIISHLADVQSSAERLRQRVGALCMPSSSPSPILAILRLLIHCFPPPMKARPLTQRRTLSMASNLRPKAYSLFFRSYVDPLRCCRYIEVGHAVCDLY